MASQGPLGAGTGSQVSNPIGSNNWTNVTNITASDDAYATCALTATSHYAKGDNFGFSIPSGATIDGIVVEWELSKTGTGNVFVDQIKIVKGGTVGSTDKTDLSTFATTDTVKSFGGASDLWGETWTDSDINASNFGCVLSCFKITGTPTARIDYVRVTVYYTVAPSWPIRGLAGTGIFWGQGSDSWTPAAPQVSDNPQGYGKSIGRSYNWNRSYEFPRQVCPIWDSQRGRFRSGHLCENGRGEFARRMAYIS